MCTVGRDEDSHDEEAPLSPRVRAWRARCQWSEPSPQRGAPFIGAPAYGIAHCMMPILSQCALGATEHKHCVVRCYAGGLKHVARTLALVGFFFL